MVPDAAETVTAPCLTPVTNPVELTVARVESDVVHVTPLTAFDVPSE
jgi:hypothetical protein